MIPCFNERTTLAAVVDRVRASPVALPRQIVLVDDGSRWLNRHFHRRQPGHWHFVAGNWLVTQLANLLYRAHVTDVSTGYKVFDATVLRGLPLRSEGFEFCTEVTARVRRLGYRIWEVPICDTPRTVDEGKKIRARDGLRAVWTLLRYRVAA